MNDPLAPSRTCFSLITTFEGCRLHAYPDPGTGGAPWTIGYGATGPEITRSTVWTLPQAEARLRSDVMRFALGVRRLLDRAPTTQHQFDAMVSFAYNLGLANFAASTLLKRHLAGDHAGATEEFGKWIRAAGKMLPGLVARRAAEASTYASA